MFAGQTGGGMPGCRFNAKLTDNHHRPTREKKCLTKFCFSEKMLDRTPGQLVKLLPKKAAR